MNTAWLLKEVKHKRGMTTAQVAEAIGYSREHLSKEAKGNNEHINSLIRDRFPDVFKSEEPTTVDHIAALSAMVQGIRHILVEHESKVNGISYAEAGLRVDKVLRSAAEQQLSGA